MNENFNFTSTVEIALKTAIAIKYFLSSDAQSTYKVANVKELQYQFDKFGSQINIPEINALNVMSWEEINCEVKHSENNIASVELKSTDLGIKAEVTLEKSDGKWRIRDVNNK